MYSLIVSGIGAVLAAVGSGVLLARCFREPRGELIAWSVALLGLLVSLGAQTLGHLTGFDAAMFRAMELGGQVIAPLALIVGLTEVAARGMAARFCARLYIPCVAIVAGVVLLLDQLADKPFSKAWPDPALHYQTLPSYVLMFAIGPITVLVTLIAVGTVVLRSGQPGWNAVLPAQLMAGGAALLLAYPALAQLAAYQAGVRLPVGSAFSLFCAAAAVLTWLAGVKSGRLQLAALRKPGPGGPRSGAVRPGPGRAGGGWDNADDTGGLEPGGTGPYPGGGSYRPGPAGSGAARRYERDERGGYDWQDDRPDGGQAPDWRDDNLEPSGRRREDYDPGYRPGDRGMAAVAGGDFATGDFATGDLATGEFMTGDHDPGYPVGGWQARNGGGEFGGDEFGGNQHGSGEFGGDEFGGTRKPAREDSYRAGWRDGELDRSAGASGRSGDEAARAELFGQIAIYTLLEDRVEEFDRLTQHVVEQVRSREPDTLVYIVHAVPSAPMQRILYEVYRDRAAYDWHGEQPYVVKFETDRRPYVLATNVIELGLQQAKVSPFPSVAELLGEPGYDTSGFERPDYLRDFGRPSAQPDGGAREYR